jgi:hypothetical protein
MPFSGGLPLSTLFVENAYHIITQKGLAGASIHARIYMKDITL